MKYFYNFLNNVMIGSAFVAATYLCMNNVIWGLIGYVVSYMLLDLHSYIEKKLGYPNNYFIKEEN